MTSTLKVDTIQGKSTASNVIFPAGMVIQTVESFILPYFATASTSLVTSGLECAITPKFSTSKVLINLNVNGVSRDVDADYIVFHIYKNSSNHHSVATNHGQTSAGRSATLSHQYLDSPSTTSATTYTLYMRSGTGGGQVGYNNYGIGGNSSTRSTIILQEISG